MIAVAEVYVGGDLPELELFCLELSLKCRKEAPQ